MASSKNKILILLFIAAILSSNFVYAESKPVEEALENVKDGVSDLVTAKDEKDSLSFPLRAETFKRVVELSLSEAKELKLKLLAFDSITTSSLVGNWRNEMIQDLNEALSYYERQKELKNEPQTIEEVKALAQGFKTWREENYLPLANETNEFLLVKQEEKAIEVALKRSKKINEDLLKLQKSKILAITKNLGQLNKLLLKADSLIGESKKQNEAAYQLFLDSLETTSTVPAPTLLLLPQEESGTSTASSTIPSDDVPLLSIKDLIKVSLNKIKEAYQVFIEMSSLVRKLLG